MTTFRLSLHSALYYAWSHLCVLGGVALAVAVLVGALLVGDSVKFSLAQSALLRLGKIHQVLELRGRYVRADLADRLRQERPIPMAPVLFMRGIAIRPGETGGEPLQINNIQILGVDDRFQELWPVTPSGRGQLIPDDGVALNATLAGQLGVKPGDRVSLRFSKPSFLPLDAPLSSRKGDETVRGTFTVSAIWDDARLGRFSLAANQMVPGNAFVPLKALQALAGVGDRANLLLAGPGGDGLEEALRKVWLLDDIGLSGRGTADKRVFQLESDRVILDPEIGRVATNLPQVAASLTYLVNSISRHDAARSNSTPYSFVLAMDPSRSPGLGIAPAEMEDDEILVNRWLADRLSLKAGDEITLSYYEFNAWGRFVETSRVFRVWGVSGMDVFKQERELAPRFPGLSDAGRCADWDIGMPLDPKLMEDQDNEDYWNEYRDTPKAVVTLKAGQAMWSNRFGNLTALRFSPDVASPHGVESALRARLNPAELGLVFTPVREIALKAAGEAMDFGGLFIGMSFFVMVAALMLTALLFSLAIQQRAREIGVLLAVGFRPFQVRRLLVGESIWVAGAGTIVGSVGGALYTAGLLWGLSHLWQGAVASTAIRFHAEPATILTGALIGFCMALVAMIVSVWRQTVRSTRDLLAGERDESVVPAGRGWVGLMLPVTGLCGAGLLVLSALSGNAASPVEIFFGAGALLLVSLLGLSRWYFIRLSGLTGHLTLVSLGLRNLGRHRRRSVTVVGLIASGCFLVFAVSAMQENLEKTAHKRTSGTGGFALLGESTLPLTVDLTRPEGWARLHLDSEPCMKGVTFVTAKVRDGDDASCLNLNRAQSPRVVGVDPAEFEKRGAFMDPHDAGNGWSLLDEALGDGAVPGLAGDANTLQWGLKKQAGRLDGDCLLMRGEKGGLFKVRLVGALPMRLSVFQGSVLIPTAAFSERWPSEAGARMFLVDSPRGREEEVRDCLFRRLGKFGVNVLSTVERLKAYYVVESTYLAMFLALGGLGLLLGSAGMGIVVLRAIRERRAEFALLKAVGYSDHQVRSLVAHEHRVMLGLGLAAGILSALAAIWPNLRESSTSLPLATMLAFLAGITLFHLFWIRIAIRWAFRTALVAALREP